MNAKEEVKTVEIEKIEPFKSEGSLSLIYWIGVPLLIIILILILLKKHLAVRVSTNSQNDKTPTVNADEISIVLEKIKADIFQDYVSYHVFDLLLILGSTHLRKEMEKDFCNRAKPVIDWNCYLNPLNEDTKIALEMKVKKLTIDSDEIDNELPWKLGYREIISNQARKLAILTVKRKAQDLGLSTDLTDLV